MPPACSSIDGAQVKHFARFRQGAVGHAGGHNGLNWDRRNKLHYTFAMFSKRAFALAGIRGWSAQNKPLGHGSVCPSWKVSARLDSVGIISWLQRWRERKVAPSAQNPASACRICPSHTSKAFLAISALCGNSSNRIEIESYYYNSRRRRMWNKRFNSRRR